MLFVDYPRGQGWEMTQRVTFTRVNLHQKSWEQPQLPLGSHRADCSRAAVWRVSFSLVSSTLTTIKITTAGEGKETGLNSEVCYQFFLGH